MQHSFYRIAEVLQLVKVIVVVEIQVHKIVPGYEAFDLLVKAFFKRMQRLVGLRLQILR